MAQDNTYVQTRQAEDVQDVIYNISPIDTPVSQCPRPSAQQVSCTSGQKTI